MRVTPPVPITDLQLVSCSAIEPAAFPPFNASTTYPFGAIVTVAADYRIYESLQSGNLNHAPLTSPIWWRPVGYTETPYSASTTYPLGATVSSDHRIYESLIVNNLGQPLPIWPDTETSAWAYVVPTNRFAGFDLSSNTQTIWPSPCTLSVAPGQRVNTLSLLGMSANEIVINATSVTGGGTVYSKVIDLNTRSVSDGYEYAFEPFSTQPSIVLFDLPPYTDIVVSVTLSSTSGNVKYGSFILGTYVYLGKMQYDGENSSLGTSTVERDLWGKAKLRPRRSIDKNRYSIEVPSARVNKVRAAKKMLNAVPALWNGLDDSASDWFDTFTILGVYSTFDISNLSHTKGMIILEVEEI